MYDADADGRMDPGELRKALGSFATGVTIITTVSSNGENIGITANSFNSVSLDPPLVLFSLSKNAFSLPLFLSAGRFNVHILNEDQDHLSQHFSRPSTDKWFSVEHDKGANGCPRLPGCAAYFECKLVGNYEGGDHTILLGQVLRMDSDPTAQPLVFQRGRYGHFREGQNG